MDSGLGWGRSKFWLYGASVLINWVSTYTKLAILGEV